MSSKWREVARGGFEQGEGVGRSERRRGGENGECGKQRGWVAFWAAVEMSCPVLLTHKKTQSWHSTRQE